jgi:hypothetical protein
MKHWFRFDEFEVLFVDKDNGPSGADFNPHSNGRAQWRGGKLEVTHGGAKYVFWPEETWVGLGVYGRSLNPGSAVLARLDDSTYLLLRRGGGLAKFQSAEPIELFFAEDVVCCSDEAACVPPTAATKNHVLWLDEWIAVPRPPGRLDPKSAREVPREPHTPVARCSGLS